MSRIKTVEYDPGWGWIARNPFTGDEILEPGFRWNTRESARTVVWDARHLSDEAKMFKQLCTLAGVPHGVQGGENDRA